MFAMCYTKPTQIKEQYIHIDMDPNNINYNNFVNYQLLGDYILSNNTYINVNNNNSYIYFDYLPDQFAIYLNIHYSSNTGYSYFVDCESYYQEILTYPRSRYYNKSYKLY